MEQNDKLGILRLQYLVRATCLRRTKQKVVFSEELKLPPRSEREEIVSLHPDDQYLYDLVKKAAQEKAARLSSHPKMGWLTKDGERNILVLLNCLRRICDHGQQLLPESWRKMIEKGASTTDAQQQQIYARECSICGGEIDNESSATNIVCTNCATSEEDGSTSHLRVDHSHGGREASSGLPPASFGTSSRDKITHRPSAKVIALLDNLQRQKSISISHGTQRKRYSQNPLLFDANQTPG